MYGCLGLILKDFVHLHFDFVGKFNELLKLSVKSFLGPSFHVDSGHLLVLGDLLSVLLSLLLTLLPLHEYMLTNLGSLVLYTDQAKVMDQLFKLFEIGLANACTDFVD
jgi:hypothetical protein